MNKTTLDELGRGQDSLRQVIMYDYNNKHSKKIRVKVKETDLAWKSQS